MAGVAVGSRTRTPEEAAKDKIIARIVKKPSLRQKFQEDSLKSPLIAAGKALITARGSIAEHIECLA